MNTLFSACGDTVTMDDDDTLKIDRNADANKSLKPVMEVEMYVETE